jgi:hypothetical protein
MVAGHGAAPVDRFALTVAQNVHQAFIGKRLEDPVGRGERNGHALVLQDPVQLLGADEVVQLIQGGADGPALLGDALFLAARCRGWRSGISLGAERHGWTRFRGDHGKDPDYQPSPRGHRSGQDPRLAL